LVERDWRFRLDDIDAAIADIEAIVLTRSDDALDKLEQTDRLLHRALKNAFAELGEAVKGLPASETNRHPHVPWRGLAGQRDIVVHAYFSVEPALLRQTVLDDFPPLKAALAVLRAG
jgi:uncharacterized protein with HEPN domain